MSSNDVHRAQPTANAGLDALPATSHPQPPPASTWSPAPAALFALAEAASTLQPPEHLASSHPPPTTATHTSAPLQPESDGHTASITNVPPTTGLTLPELNALPPLGDIMPPPNASASAPIPIPHQTPVPALNLDNHDQADSSEDDEDNDGSDEEEQQQQSTHRRHRWRPLAECMDEPSHDELEHIQSKVEHSAKDVKYWEKKTFFDVDDEEIIMEESGRIEFSVTYNGTKEKPNKARVMLSDVVHIGGYDWRIKFYPRGDNSSYLSIYIECVSMRSSQSSEFEEFQLLPFPQLADDKTKLKKRRSIAAQIGVVMYNPAEPRVYEFHSEAHQYKHKSADYGWQKFSHDYHDNFHQRRFGQRTAILKNDTLAFTAFIRVVNDPTGCMWVHDSKLDTKALFQNSVETTGLRPFIFRGPEFPAMGVLLHVPQFRSLIYRTKSNCKPIGLFQTFLMKMLSRKCSPGYGSVKSAEIGDAVTSLQWFAQKLAEGCDKYEFAHMKCVIGTLRPEEGYAVGSNRLKTKHVRSVKEAVEAHAQRIPASTLVTLELQRQDFDSRTRKWKKLVNKVEMDECLSIGGSQYHLYAYVTHTGALTSNKHTLYVRPRGVGTLWYGYREAKVVALTQKQATGTHCGVDKWKDVAKDGTLHMPQKVCTEWAREEVAYVVFYVRYDRKSVRSLDVESWPGIRQYFLDSHIRITDPRTHAEPERDGRDTAPASTSGSGADTPQWRMDGDDVVMSDAEENDASSPVDPLAASVHLTSVTTTTEPSVKPSLVTIDALGQDYYYGGKLDDMRHGYGHLITMLGDEYTGDFQHNLPHGQGTMLYAANGSTYTGAWHAGKHHGQGSLTESNGNKYVGGWEHGFKHGAFTLTGTFSDEDRSICNICYGRDITTAFYDCGHVLACSDCASKMENCPVCRKRILARVQLYGVRIVLD